MDVNLKDGKLKSFIRLGCDVETSTKAELLFTPRRSKKKVIRKTIKVLPGSPTVHCSV